MLKRLLLFFLLLAVCLSEQAFRSGIDRAAMDPTCKPCENFWRYANGGWVDKNPIPARLPSWGPSRILSASNARLWGTQYRPEYMQTLISTDPHPMPKARHRHSAEHARVPQGLWLQVKQPHGPPPDRQCRLW